MGRGPNLPPHEEHTLRCELFVVFKNFKGGPAEQPKFLSWTTAALTRTRRRREMIMGYAPDFRTHSTADKCLTGLVVTTKCTCPQRNNLAREGRHGHEYLYINSILLAAEVASQSFR